VCDAPLLYPLALKMDAGEMLITPGREDGRVHGSKAGLGAVQPQSARVESVPLRSSPTTEG